MITQVNLFSDAPTAKPETLSKRGFAEHVRLTPGRVSQLIEKGLPVEANGRINVAAGLAWYDANIDPNRRKAPAAEPTPIRSTRDELERLKVERERLKLDAERGALVSRKVAERVIFGRARGERDKWLGFASRAAPEIAAAVGCEVSAIFPALDRAIRDHLRELAAMPIESFGDDG